LHLWHILSQDEVASNQLSKKATAYLCAYYITNKNACLQGHFYALIQGAQDAAASRAQRAKDLRSKDFCAYYITNKNACSQGHFYALIQGAQDALASGAQRAKDLRSKDFCAYYNTYPHLCQYCKRTVKAPLLGGALSFN